MKMSELPKGKIIRDAMRYGYERKIDPTVSLPRRTLECYYSMMSDNLLEYNISDHNFNEVQPLLFLSLKHSYKHL
jgi:hypothetical protein